MTDQYTFQNPVTQYAPIDTEQPEIAEPGLETELTPAQTWARRRTAAPAGSPAAVR